MIRFLQKDTKAIKIIFGVIIGISIVGMVLYLIPGIGDNVGMGGGQDVYATVNDPGIWGRITGESTEVTNLDVQRTAQQQLTRMEQQQHQQMPAIMLNYISAQVGQQLVQQEILRHEADRIGLQVTDADLQHELSSGQLSQYFFPNGQFIGPDAYGRFINQNFDMSVSDFETKYKQDMEMSRLQSLVTGGITVSDNAVRQSYLQQGTKVKFDYAVISSADLDKQINPSDADLQAYFKQNAARYASAMPETRKIEYVAFDASALPGGRPQISDAELQAYYSAHAQEYAVPEQVQTRHILITVPAGADAKTDAAAKAKAADILKQVKTGGNFADLAKKNSEDPGSKDKGGELPMMGTAGLDPAYAKAAMALNPGQTSDLVRSQFGYHIIQTIAKDAAHTKPLSEVKEQITPLIEQQKVGTAEQSFAEQLAAQAQKDGLDKAAAAHGLHTATTDYIARNGVVPALADSTALLTQAFTVKKGDPPASVATQDGYAVFQVLDVKSAHAPNFDEYKSHIADDYRQAKVPEMLNAQLNKLADRAKVLNDLKKAADELHIPVKSSDLVDRTGQVPDLGAMSGPASVAFTLAKGAISGPINTGTAGGVLMVTDKQQPTPEDIAKNFDQTKQQLLEAQQRDAYGVFVGTLTDRYEKAGAVRYTTKPAASPFGN